MGPLVEHGIISDNTNLLIAFFIGTAFGFVLEQSGFSSSRKLAGVFYGYDMTVMKVFFTAAITAMIGLLFFGLFGWIDLDTIFVNPTFLWSAIVGGVIMGAGFILGGYCPGTSICGASIGKIDAMVFIAGLFIGVLIFGEGFAIWENLYMSEPMGPQKVSGLLGWSDGAFALALTVIALGMFVFAEWLEKRSKKVEY